MRIALIIGLLTTSFILPITQISPAFGAVDITEIREKFKAACQHNEILDGHSLTQFYESLDYSSMGGGGASNNDGETSVALDARGIVRIKSTSSGGGGESFVHNVNGDKIAVSLSFA